MHEECDSMSNTFASINASVGGQQKMPNFTPCEAFNPKATVSKWSRQFMCINNGLVAYGGSGAIATRIASGGKDAPEFGKQSFEVSNCLLRKVEEFNGPPSRMNVVCFTCASDSVVRFFFVSRQSRHLSHLNCFETVLSQERYFSFASKERCDLVFKVHSPSKDNLPVPLIHSISGNFY